MTKQTIIEQTIKVINQLPDDKAEELFSFAAFLMKRFEEQQLTEGLKQFAVESNSFEFLNEEEDLYSTSDLKELYNND